MISRLHYITQGNIPGKTHIELAEQALQGGVDWVQLRMKTESDEEKRALAKEMRRLCTSFGAQFIINDHVELAKEFDADGIHLGKTDMPVPDARKIFGEEKIYGGTANEWQDIEKLHSWSVDYIGFGPLRFTTTKDNLSPIVGIEGYRNTVAQMNQQNINIPMIAIGGVQLDDLAPLAQTGVYGVAIASPINKAEHAVQVAEDWQVSVSQAFKPSV